MLVWNALEETPNIFTMAGVSMSREARRAYEGYFCAVNRIILQDKERFDSFPTYRPLTGGREQLR